MRYIVRDCSQPTFHPMHVSEPRHSMYSCVEEKEIFICSGASSLGDRRIRESHDIARLAEEIRVEQVARELAARLVEPSPS